MSTHVLASQVLSRYQTERTNRCQMLSVLARQLERFRDVQLSWQEQRMAARAAVSKAQQDVVEKEEEVKMLIKEKEDLVRDYKKRLEVLLLFILSLVFFWKGCATTSRQDESAILIPLALLRFASTWLRCPRMVSPTWVGPHQRYQGGEGVFWRRPFSGNR